MNFEGGVEEGWESKGGIGEDDGAESYAHCTDIYAQSVWRLGVMKPHIKQLCLLLLYSLR